MPDRATGEGVDGPAALLWDNDGVLVDTEALYFNATRAVLAGADVTLTRADFADISLRRGESCFVLAAQRGASDDQLHRMRLERDRRYLELIGAGVAPIDGVRETLSAVHGSAPMAIVTSSELQHFNAIHATSSLLEFFDLILTAEDYARSKPHPEPYLTAAERLGVEPRDCVVIEDTERGVTAAVGAGMDCVAIPNDLSSTGDFAAAWRVIETIRELPPLVEHWPESRAAR